MSADKTIPDVVRAAAVRFGATCAIRDGSTSIPFAALAAWMDRAARALVALGVRRGDRVAIWAPNGWRWIVAALGAHAAGAAIVPINTRYKGTEAEYVLAKSGARVLFTARDFLGVDYAAMLEGRALPALERMVLVDDEDSWSTFAGHGDTERALPPVHGDDLSDVIFTSGTTGAPKGVMCTHGQTVRAFAEWSRIVGLAAGDRYLVALPFFHSFGYKAGWLACILTGATCVPHAVFDVEQVLSRVAAERITALPGPPSLYQSILAHPRRKQLDLSTLRLAVTGAAAVPVELVKRMRSELAFQTVLTGYGLTEASGVSTLCRQDDDPETIATTSGRAIEGVEVRIADDGEILVRGYTLMKGYFDDPAATAEAIDEGGWLKTGDIGEMDARGYVKITDRKKDMFIVGGFNAYPAEIESVLAGHPAIDKSAVIGIPDERLGEVGMAFVVLRAGGEASEAEIIAFCRDRMANYKVPRRVALVRELPMNATGKVQKFRLRELARGDLL